MADCYVDDTNGLDDAGTAGTSGDPYASIQYALDNFGSWSTTAGNTLHLANTSAFVLTTALDFDTSVAKAEAPLGVVPWDNGGSLTGTGPLGETISPCAEIDGNDAVASFCDANTAYVCCKDLKIHSTTAYVTNVGILSNNTVFCCVG